MMALTLLPCDGCGQPASAEHIARRLKRLEQATRFRPIHIQTLFLGAAAPAEENEYLYDMAENDFQGEGSRVLERVGIECAGRAREAVLGEFQRGGDFLAHVLECPVEEGTDVAGQEELLRGRVATILMRLKRSLRPKRVVLISSELKAVAQALGEAAPEIEWVDGAEKAAAI
jgi:hypothetical protein